MSHLTWSRVSGKSSIRHMCTYSCAKVRWKRTYSVLPKPRQPADQLLLYIGLPRIQPYKSTWFDGPAPEFTMSCRHDSRRLSRLSRSVGVVIIASVSGNVTEENRPSL